MPTRGLTANGGGRAAGNLLLPEGREKTEHRGYVDVTIGVVIIIAFFHKKTMPPLWEHCSRDRRHITSSASSSNAPSSLSSSSRLSFYPLFSFSLPLKSFRKNVMCSLKCYHFMLSTCPIFSLHHFTDIAYSCCFFESPRMTRRCTCPSD